MDTAEPIETGAERLARLTRRAGEATEDRSFAVYHIHHATEVTEAGDPLPVYVGKSGSAARCRHWRRNADVTAMGRAGLLRKPVIVANGLTLDEAYELEVAEIARIGRADLGEGPLRNRCDGGAGVPRHIKPAWLVAKMRATPMHANSRAALDKANKGRKLPPWHVEKLIAAKRGKPGRGYTPEQRERMSQAMKASPKHAAAIAAREAKWREPGFVDPRSKPRSPKWLASNAAMLAERNRSPEMRARTAERNRARRAAKLAPPTMPVEPAAPLTTMENA